MARPGTYQIECTTGNGGVTVRGRDVSEKTARELVEQGSKHDAGQYLVKGGLDLMKGGVDVVTALINSGACKKQIDFLKEQLGKSEEQNEKLRGEISELAKQLSGVKDALKEMKPDPESQKILADLASDVKKLCDALPGARAEGKNQAEVEQAKAEGASTQAAADAGMRNGREMNERIGISAAELGNFRFPCTLAEEPQAGQGWYRLVLGREMPKSAKLTAVRAESSGGPPLKLYPSASFDAVPARLVDLPAGGSCQFNVNGSTHVYVQGGVPQGSVVKVLCTGVVLQTDFLTSQFALFKGQPCLASCLNLDTTEIPRAKRAILDAYEMTQAIGREREFSTLCRVFGFHYKEESRKLYVIHEFAKGSTMTEWLYSPALTVTGLSGTEVHRVLRDVFQALKLIHDSNGTRTHGSLCPDSIRIVKDPLGRWRGKVVPFGWHDSVSASCSGSSGRRTLRQPRQSDILPCFDMVECIAVNCCGFSRDPSRRSVRKEDDQFACCLIALAWLSRALHYNPYTSSSTLFRQENLALPDGISDDLRASLEAALRSEEGDFSAKFEQLSQVLDDEEAWNGEFEWPTFATHPHKA